MSTKDKKPTPASEARQKPSAFQPVKNSKEVGGRDGPEPTRYGDWEKKGIISDF